VNTYLSITASVTTACFWSRVHFGKLDMEIVLNATIAGGLIIGTSCDVITHPAHAVLVGMIGGFISAVGFSHLGSKLHEKFNFHDTCGVHSLHGLPAVLACIVSMFACGLMNYTVFRELPETQN